MTLASLGLLLGCRASADPPVAESAAPAIAEPVAPEAPADPLPTTEWHQEPVLEKRVGNHIVLLNHADATLETATILAQLEQQYDWLADYVGVAPRWIFVHVGTKYPCGFMIRPGDPADVWPEMFLQVGSIFDTSANYAHEMMHCFMSELGGAIPHWFNESLSDLAYIDAEIELWKRRREEPWLPTLDHADNRSYELIVLRSRFGRDFIRKSCAALVKRKDECRATFTPDHKVDVKNELIVAALSEAAGQDVLPILKELGFNPRTRERQRGY